ncbi:GNAT superfamily N-acetyltransferase [Cryobacterium sp. MP_M3]|uniref:GNAT family N-acetyltransferase n=1 Tax=unclassified Cryobacterium TaxID=2649013 RepID=UPI0018CB6E7A|nr:MULTISPECIES: GNAT family N-acetyltransferase [unclassified Cryobacterium]MBG6060065.1 GNAT superfamily N-acetyltransferase [Cryobacterium sp. MP_M3]
MTHAIREAEPRDLIRLEDIENKADSLFLERFQPESWRLAPPAQERLIVAGYVLVVAEVLGGEAVGFVHVVLTNEVAHLEQLAVLPSHGRRGYGRTLVEAAKQEALRRRFSEITLRTFAEIPWNAPFYTDCGFVETEPATAFHIDLLNAEIKAGSASYGRRIQMVCTLS